MAERALASKTSEAKKENPTSCVLKAEHSPSAVSPVEHILFLHRTIGNQAVQRLMKSGALQTKLRISQPGDVYEQEADRVAGAVMRMAEPEVSESDVVPDNQQRDIVRRKCSGCTEKPLSQPAKEDKKEELQAKEIPGSTPEVTPGLEASINAIRGGGQPLPEPVRAFFEPRFERDFSGVRVHTDARAAEAAREVNARAFTVGKDIVFSEGEYVPETNVGQRLLGHELTHVIQQGAICTLSGSSPTQGKISASSAYALQRDMDGGGYQPDAGVPGVGKISSAPRSAYGVSLAGTDGIMYNGLMFSHDETIGRRLLEQHIIGHGITATKQLVANLESAALSISADRSSMYGITQETELYASLSGRLNTIIPLVRKALTDIESTRKITPVVTRDYVTYPIPVEGDQQFILQFAQKGAVLRFKSSRDPLPPQESPIPVGATFAPVLWVQRPGEIIIRLGEDGREVVVSYGAGRRVERYNAINPENPWGPLLVNREFSVHFLGAIITHPGGFAKYSYEEKLPDEAIAEPTWTNWTKLGKLPYVHPYARGDSYYAGSGRYQGRTVTINYSEIAALKGFEEGAIASAKFMVELALYAIPYVGPLILVGQALAGRTIWGDHLSTEGRVLYGLFALLPVVSRLAGATRSAAELTAARELAAAQGIGESESLTLIRGLRTFSAEERNFIETAEAQLRTGKPLTETQAGRLATLVNRISAKGEIPKGVGWAPETPEALSPGAKAASPAPKPERAPKAAEPLKPAETKEAKPSVLTEKTPKAMNAPPPISAGETPRIILYRGTVYRFIRGRSRQIHDLGEGAYMTLDPELAVRYAQIRRAEVRALEPGTPGIVLRIETDPGELGRIFDFYNNPALRGEWETFLRGQPGGEYVLRGGPAELYNAHFENWLTSKGMSLEQFDVIIGPEYIRGGSQVCIRNEGLADRLLARAEEWARAHEPVTLAYPETPTSRSPTRVTSPVAPSKSTPPPTKPKTSPEPAAAPPKTRLEELSIDPQTGEINLKSQSEARTILQAEQEGLVKNARRPDLRMREPNLDFKIDGGYADIKTPINPNRRTLLEQAKDMAKKINAYDSDVTVIIDLKNLDAVQKAQFKTELVNAGAKMGKIKFLND